jgi:hypothetical protein
VLDGRDAWPDGDWELCVTSPGIALDHPWQIAARTAGVRVISELQLGAERFRAMGGRMLAVTGSKGKSSVVKLVADALEGVPCGNYGLPLCEVVLQGLAAEGSLPFAVVEVSSFQMETTELPADTFEAAAILNLQEDHLDRHGSVSAYHALKRKLLDFAKIKIVENVGIDPVFAGTGIEECDKKEKDFELFANSDAMIHDCSSFIGEYLFTGKPCCYMLKSMKDIKKVMNPMGVKCMENYYKAFDRKDILKFIDDVVVAGQDPMKEARERFCQEELKFNYPHATDTVLDTIKTTLGIQ